MENKAPNEGAAVPCFNHIEESNIKFSQNQSIPNNNINKINEQINNLNFHLLFFYKKNKILP